MMLGIVAVHELLWSEGKGVTLVTVAASPNVVELSDIIIEQF